jgi:holliday junction DNA helicase RuvA
VIASVDGVVGAVAADSLVIEVGGIGYRVFAAPAILASAQPGGRLKLHTYHLVREDQQALYAFRNAEELGFFTLLLTVNGVGPKVALAIVGSRPTPDLQLAIMAQDQAVLVAIPGIGKKLAERIIFELKEKVTAAGVSVAGPAAAGEAATEGEIVAALQALGYSLAEAREASRAALSEVGVSSTLEERVKAALRSLLRELVGPGIARTPGARPEPRPRDGGGVAGGRGSTDGPAKEASGRGAPCGASRRSRRRCRTPWPWRPGQIGAQRGADHCLIRSWSPGRRRRPAGTGRHPPTSAP